MVVFGEGHYLIIDLLTSSHVLVENEREGCCVLGVD